MLVLMKISPSLSTRGEHNWSFCSSITKLGWFWFTAADSLIPVSEPFAITKWKAEHLCNWFTGLAVLPTSQSKGFHISHHITMIIWVSCCWIISHNNLNHSNFTFTSVFLDCVKCINSTLNCCLFSWLFPGLFVTKDDVRCQWHVGSCLGADGRDYSR